MKAKLKMSKQKPKESKLFANEILHGAPLMQNILATSLKQTLDEKVAVIDHWVREGKLANVNGHHLFFSIWAMTQHYADFDVQVKASFQQIRTLDKTFVLFDASCRFLPRKRSRSEPKPCSGIVQNPRSPPCTWPSIALLCSHGSKGTAKHTTCWSVTLFSRSPGPIPEACKICGEPIVPALKIISLFALTEIKLLFIQ